MADSKYSALPPAALLTGAEIFAVDQAGNSVRTTVSAVGNNALGTYTAPGIGAQARTVSSKLAESISVFDFMTAAQIANVQAGLLTLDISGAFNTALTACTASSIAKLVIPSGSYLIAATINRPAGVYMMGDGAEFTALVSTSTFNGPVIASTGAFNNVINRGGVQNLAIFGSWGTNHANTLSVGISESFTNRSIHKDVRIHGCFRGMYGIGVWQVLWDNIQVDGTGTQQNATGFYLDQLLLTLPVGTSNAINAVNCVAQDVSDTGWRLLNPNGCKLVDCEAENGINGFFIGNTAAGCYPIQFGQFTGCVSDTNTGIGFFVQQGSNASPCNYMQFANCWAGTHGNLGVYFDGCSGLNWTNGIIGNNTGAGLRLNNSVNCIIATTQFVQDNLGAQVGIGDITISGGSFNKIIGCFSSMATGASVSLLESGGTNSNTIEHNTLLQGATLIGAGTRALYNQGYNPVGISGHHRRWSVTRDALPHAERDLYLNDSQGREDSRHSH